MHSDASPNTHDPGSYENINMKFNLCTNSQMRIDRIVCILYFHHRFMHTLLARNIADKYLSSR